MAREKKNKSQNISFRLTESEYEPYKNVIEQLNVSKSEFFRSVLLNKVDILEKKNDKDYQKLLFLWNKISNNMNQIAKRLNVDSKTGVISQRRYDLAINELITIESQLKRMLDKC